MFEFDARLPNETINSSLVSMRVSTSSRQRQIDHLNNSLGKCSVIVWLFQLWSTEINRRRRCEKKKLRPVAICGKGNKSLLELTSCVAIAIKIIILGCQPSRHVTAFFSRLLTLHSLFESCWGHGCDPAAKELFFPILFDGFYESFA